jgi:C_GCAxxG_C_C family probable redox protein
VLRPGSLKQIERRKEMAKKSKSNLASEKARNYFIQGFNCAESISLSFKETLGIEDSSLPRLATGFGGGVARKGSLCGAFIGSVMALGMKMGRTDPKDEKGLSAIYEKCRQFWDRFEKEFGSNLCCEIIGCHLDNQDERQKWLDSGGRERCADLVGRTAEMLSAFMEAI